MGISSYGIREIARCKQDIEHRNKVFSSLITVNTVLMLFCVLVLVLCTWYIPTMHSYKEFIGIGIIKIIFNVFLIEWFFQGIQNFKYITIRSVCIRLLYVIAIFVFVKEKDDAAIYYLLTTLIVVVNAITNWTYSRKFCHFSFKEISIKLYIIPILTFGYYKILTSLYTTFNTTYLGFSCGDTEVGYYTTATKLYTIIMGVFHAFTVVMIPRVSAMLANKEYDAIQNIANKTFESLFAIASPIMILCVVHAPVIIDIISGKGYENAIIPFRIVISLLLIVGMEQIVIQQFLMASRSNKPIIIISTVGAAVAIIGNILFTANYGSVASSCIWVCSELCVLLFGYQLMKKHINVSIEWYPIIKILLLGVVYLIMNITLSIFLSPFLSFVLSLIASCLLFIILYTKIYRDSYISSILLSIKNRFL